jgi:hypothetical protein
MASAPFSAAPKFGANSMFEKILIANCGDQLPKSSATAQPNRPVAGSRKRYFAAEAKHV